LRKGWIAEHCNVVKDIDGNPLKNPTENPGEFVKEREDQVSYEGWMFALPKA
jgi:hypothetical protein